MRLSQTIVKIDGVEYIRAAPGFAPKKGKKTHVSEVTSLKNKIFESVVASCPSLTGKWCVSLDSANQLGCRLTLLPLPNPCLL